MLRRQESADAVDSLMLQRVQSISSEVLAAKYNQVTNRSQKIENLDPEDMAPLPRIPAFSPIFPHQQSVPIPSTIQRLKGNDFRTPVERISLFDDIKLSPGLTPEILPWVQQNDPRPTSKPSPGSLDYLLYAGMLLETNDAPSAARATPSDISTATPGATTITVNPATAVGAPSVVGNSICIDSRSAEEDSVITGPRRSAKYSRGKRKPGKTLEALRGKETDGAPLRKRVMKQAAASLTPPAGQPLRKKLVSTASLWAIATQMQSRSFNETGRQCSCKKNRCLRLYCECFASNQLCDKMNCECGRSCRNDRENRSERLEAMVHALRKNKNVFDQERATRKQKKAALLLEDNNVPRRCSCRRSKCLKRYCECFHVGTTCSGACSCVGCGNKTISSE